MTLIVFIFNVRDHTKDYGYFMYYSWKWLVDFSVKANCPHVGPGPTDEMPSVGVFLRDPPNPYLREFRRKLW